MPNLYIIAGCNGAGKTTASFTVLPEMLNCDEFINADEIARGLSPFNLYIPICDYWMVFNNSKTPSELIAEGYSDKDLDIKNIHTFDTLKQLSQNDKKR
jgi:predicted ABC-type ATPase